MRNLAFALVAALLVGGGAYWLLSGEEKAPPADSSVAVSIGTSAPAAPAPVTAASTAAAVATATASSTAPVPSTITGPADFARLADHAQAALPTTEKLKALKQEDVEHRTPPLVLQAGVDIGDVAEAVEKNPALAPQALDFYAKCARRAEVSETARALCLSNQRELARKQGVEVSEKGVAPGVVKLADQLKPAN